LYYTQDIVLLSEKGETLYEADQTAVVGGCAAEVQSYFVYCLTKSTADPLTFLATGPHPLPTGPRSMWCTAPMLHAAGRKVGLLCKAVSGDLRHTQILR
jgi:hypothetical protein